MVTKLNTKMFSGTGKVFDGTLAAIVMGMAEDQARRIAAGIDDITDNSGGTNDAGGLRLPATFTKFEAGTTDATAKAEFETSCGVVRDGIKELLAQANTIAAKVPAFNALTDSMGGTAADGTIAAIDDSMTGTSASGSLVAYAGAVTLFATLNARMAQMLVYVNKLRAAVGMAAIASALTADGGLSTVFAAVDTGTGDAVGGTDDTTDATVSKAEADAALDVMSDNIKTLATALNAVTADANASAALTVVVG